MNNVKYWEKRAEDKMKAQYKKGDALDKQLKEQYEKALAEIGKNIADFYMRFAKDNNMSYVDAVKQLTGSEYNRWRKSIDEYIDELEQMADIEGSESNDFRELLLELNTLAMKSRINRLEGLMMNIQLELANLYQKEHIQVTGLLKDVAEDVYYQTIYNVHVGRGIGHSFSKLDSQTVEDIMNYPWSGDNYSSRIWKQRDKLADTIKQELTQKFIQGKDVRTTAKAIADRMNVNYKNACALVETETCYIAGQTTLKGYTATGMEQYQYLATLDNRTSELCRNEDGKVFNIDDAVVGVNYPPLHVHCRSTTIPYFFNDENGQRAARGADGKTYYVSGDMTYKDWYNKYVKGNPAEELAEKKGKNLSGDKKQYREYRKVLGKDAPVSIDKFQELKYNNNEEWNQLKKIYTVKSNIKNGIQKLDIEEGKQGKHIKGHNNYTEGRSYLTVSMAEAQKLVNKYAGTGEIRFNSNGGWDKKEIIKADKNIGVDVNNKTHVESATNRFKIHYSSKGVHIVPMAKE
jgi:SPP1 gp7 family putative phage head morphogenesis protein